MVTMVPFPRELSDLKSWQLTSSSSAIRMRALIVVLGVGRGWPPRVDRQIDGDDGSLPQRTFRSEKLATYLVVIRNQNARAHSCPRRRTRLAAARRPANRW